MKKIWQQKYSSSSVTKTIEDYCFQEGASLDIKLVPYDVYGSLAHVSMLVKIGIIKSTEFKEIKKELINILQLWKKGEYLVNSGDEDVHSKIEATLIEKTGDLGKKIHTARSRNDQILVDLRLFSKEQLFIIKNTIYRLIVFFVKLAKEYEFVPMPGYTHLQKAMPSSLGMWYGSFAESLLDDLLTLKSAYILNDQSPLGTGAAYGVSLPVDRKLTAELLGFYKVQNNSLYAQVSRVKIQLVIMQSLSQIMLTLSRFAQDLLLFTTSEFDFFNVDSQLCTGSSIMPQKKNLDVMEYLRAKTHSVLNYSNMIATTAAGLPSGYNADFAETKGPFIKVFEIVNKSLQTVNLALVNIDPNIDILKKACSSEIYATHAAYQLVKNGTPFREAYQNVKINLKRLHKYDPVRILKQTNHLGGPGNLKLNNILKKLKKDSTWWNQQKIQYEKAIDQLTQPGL